MKLLKGKRGIILLTPYAIGWPDQPECIGEDGEKRTLTPAGVLLHEIAHFHLRHTGFKNEFDEKEKQKKANNLAEKWCCDYMEYINSGL